MPYAMAYLPPFYFFSYGWVLCECSRVMDCSVWLVFYCLCVWEWRLRLRKCCHLHNLFCLLRLKSSKQLNSHWKRSSTHKLAELMARIVHKFVVFWSNSLIARPHSQNSSYGICIWLAGWAQQAVSTLHSSFTLFLSMHCKERAHPVAQNKVWQVKQLSGVGLWNCLLQTV